MPKNMVTLVKEAESYLSTIHPINPQAKETSKLIYGYMTGFFVGEGKVTLIANHTEGDKRYRLFVMVWDSQSTKLYGYTADYDYDLAKEVLEIVKRVLTDCVYDGNDIHRVAHALAAELTNYA